MPSGCRAVARVRGARRAELVRAEHRHLDIGILDRAVDPGDPADERRRPEPDAGLPVHGQAQRHGQAGLQVGVVPQQVGGLRDVVLLRAHRQLGACAVRAQVGHERAGRVEGEQRGEGGGHGHGIEPRAA